MTVRQRALRSAGYVGAGFAILQFVYGVLTSSLAVAILSTALSFVMLTGLAFVVFVPAVWMYRRLRSGESPTVG